MLAKMQKAREAPLESFLVVCQWEIMLPSTIPFCSCVGKQQSRSCNVNRALRRLLNTHLGLLYWNMAVYLWYRNYRDRQHQFDVSCICFWLYQIFTTCYSLGFVSISFQTRPRRLQDAVQEVVLIIVLDCHLGRVG